MSEHVSLWDDPAEQRQQSQQQGDRASVELETTATVEGTDETPVTATAESDENPVAAAIAASNWSRDDVELALQVLNLLVLLYFTWNWRKQNV